MSDPANRVGEGWERNPVACGSILLRAAEGQNQQHERNQRRKEHLEILHGVAPSVIDSGLIESAISHYSGANVSFRHPAAQEAFPIETRSFACFRGKPGAEGSC